MKILNLESSFMEEPIRQEIKCSIFLEADAVIKNVISKFLKASSKEKQYYAEDILLEAKTLLVCSSYNALNPDCLICRSVSCEYFREYKYLSRATDVKTLITGRKSYV
ncbi:MAG: hypothetical protein V1933_05075 [Candidatus Omnitrophota bacterium]